jgi:hypothetical protein
MAARTACPTWLGGRDGGNHLFNARGRGMRALVERLQMFGSEPRRLENPRPERCPRKRDHESWEGRLYAAGSPSWLWRKRRRTRQAPSL